MNKIADLHSGTLKIPKEWLEQAGIEENDKVIIETCGAQIIIKSLSKNELSRQKLLKHLSYPIGTLKSQALNPHEQISILDELGGDIFDSVD